MWLGYAGLSVRYTQVSAVVAYQSTWDRRIVQAFGEVPGDIQAVIVLEDGTVLPARRPLEDLHRQLVAWNAARSS